MYCNQYGELAFWSGCWFTRCFCVIFRAAVWPWYRFKESRVTCRDISSRIRLQLTKLRYFFFMTVTFFYSYIDELFATFTILNSYQYAMLKVVFPRIWWACSYVYRSARGQEWRTETNRLQHRIQRNFLGLPLENFLKTVFTLSSISGIISNSPFHR